MQLHWSEADLCDLHHSLWRPASPSLQALDSPSSEFPIIKGCPHACKKKKNRRCAVDSGRRVFGFSAKVRS
jgi:hypothetical protein